MYSFLLLLSDRHGAHRTRIFAGQQPLICITHHTKLPICFGCNCGVPIQSLWNSWPHGNLRTCTQHIITTLDTHTGSPHPPQCRPLDTLHRRPQVFQPSSFCEELSLSRAHLAATLLPAPQRLIIRRAARSLTPEALGRRSSRLCSESSHLLLLAVACRPPSFASERQLLGALG